MSTIIFEIGVSTRYVGSKDTTEIEVDSEDLAGIPEYQWDDFVWNNLGGKEAAFDLCDMYIKRKE